MQSPIIPESAPFDPQQRAWLNGFFAGLIPPPGSAPGSAPGIAPGIAPGMTSDHLGGTAVLEAPPEEESHPWHDGSLELAERLELAKDRTVSLQMMAAMAQLDCGACGYQCETYAAAIAEGTEKSLTRCAPGGTETSKALKKMVKENAPALDESEIESAKVLKDNGPQLFDAPLLTVKKLNGKGSAKDTRFVALDLADSGLVYEAGDSLGVCPQNDPLLISQILEQLDLDAQMQVSFGNEPMLLEEVLRCHCMVTALEEDVVTLLAQHATDASVKAELQALAEDDEALAEMELLDLLERYPAVRPEVETLLAILPMLQPRLYSIASSPKVYPQEVHLTVGVVCYESGGRQRQGVASNYLTRRIEPGEAVKVFVQKAHNFALPRDPIAGVIMIGAGTGIAPFRAFLQERSTLETPPGPPGVRGVRGVRGTGGAGGDVSKTSGGGNWLFFGDQRRETDFLYERELLQYQEKNVLTRLDVAFSRDQKEKIYVQHRMLEQATPLWHWLEQGAHLYVCGDARQMGRDVDQALHQVVSQEGGLDEQATKNYIDELQKTGRYQRDVY